MSKVSIKGDPNGTGNFSIEAPNSNFDRTLNLPDEAGTVLTSSSKIKKIKENDSSVEIVDSGVGAIKFTIDGQENSRIESTNYILGIQSSNFSSAFSSDGRFQVYNDSTEWTVRLDSETGGLSYFMAFKSGGNSLGDIRSNGSSSVSYNTSSDYRLKENVVDITDGINRLKQLPVHRFNFISDPNITVDGFIAHEAAEIVPEAVTGEKDEVDEEGNPVYQGIDQAKMVPLLTDALQEAVEKIEALEARLETLEAK